MSLTLSRVQTPKWLKRPAQIMAIATFVFVPVFLTLPWQQTVVGKGQVVAFLPNQRPQVIEAPVKGRVVKWHVVEGQTVEAGELIVELTDIDPSYLDRIGAKRDAADRERDAASRQADAYKSQEDSYREARERSLKAAELKVDMASQKVSGAWQKVRSAQAAVKAAQLNLSRMKTLVDQGLRSKRDYELAELAAAKAETDVNQAKASLAEVRAQKVSLEAERVQKAAEFDAKIASAQAQAKKAEGEVAKAQKSTTQLDVDMARQSAQRVVAPSRGVVQKIMAEQVSGVVKEGDELIRLVPESDSSAIELWVDGNDAPLIQPGRHARVQFEGWPALQFMGWPSVAVGTFQAKVSFVDALGRQNGLFRVVLVPDGPGLWPNPRFLRQGVQVKGWVLLDQVSIGYEMWRQLNGFPVSVKRERVKKEKLKKGI